MGHLLTTHLVQVGFWVRAGARCALIGAQPRMRREVQVCNLPSADVTRVVCLPNLQGLVPDAADVSAAAPTHFQ